MQGEPIETAGEIAAPAASSGAPPADLTAREAGVADTGRRRWGEAHRGPGAATGTGAAERARATQALARAVPLLAVTAIALVLDTWALAQNGYANVYYSAGVESMLRSWHNLLFVSADPGGLVSIDKPPLGLWAQAASAWTFGFSPLSLLLPQVLFGVAAVAALYLIVRRRHGTLAATASGLALAVFPSFVAVSRDNNVDTLLILLMVLACGAALRAIETGRLRALLGAAALVALAFNTKALAAYLVVPGIAAAYLLCAPGPRRTRVGHLLLGGLLCAALSLAWMVPVDLSSPAHRPFVGSTADNSELDLAFGYNGFGRVGGQANGPGPAPDLEVLPDAGPASQSLRPLPPPALPRPAPGTDPRVIATIHQSPVAFLTAPGPLRLFRDGLGDQAAWLLVFALVGLLAAALARPRRGDPRLAPLIVFGGFFICEAGFLSVSSGIVHPYYASALGPGLAAMVGLGAAAMVRRWRRPGRGLLAAAGLATAAVQIALLHHVHFMPLWQVLLLPLAGAGALLAVRGRVSPSAGTAVVLAILLVAPAAYSATTWRRPVQGTFPVAGPRAVGGNGGAGLSRAQLATNEALMRYVLSHGAGGRFQLLTEASLTADGPILLGMRAAALGGYGGIDPALDGPGLARLVADGQARYVLLGGSYAYLGGNAAARAAAAVCPEVPLKAWRGAKAGSNDSFYLLDCAGRAPALAAQRAS
jgi:4-amino-4-deoxy-L-arabinose transferase-like glycosyltransferase